MPFEIISGSKSKLKIYNFLYCLVILSIFTGCIGTKSLQEDEYLLNRNKIRGVKEIETEKLEELYQQKPNRKVLKIFPISLYTWMYQVGSKKYDSIKIQKKKEKIAVKYDRKIASRAGENAKITRLQNRKQNKVAKVDNVLKNGNKFMQWGEPLSVFDSALTAATEQKMVQFLQSKGYFHGQVSSSIRYFNRRAYVTYQVIEDRPYVLDSLILTTGDSAITELVQTHQKESLIKKGDNYDTENFDQEIIRLENLMKNNGYFEFSRQFIEFAVDTTILGNRKVAMKTIVNTPSKRGFHKVFKVDSVIFTTDANTPNIGTQRKSRYFNRITYRYFEEKYSKKILDHRLFIYPGDLYSKEKTFSTQRQLANLDMFKFVNVNYDTTGGKFIANIFTSPLDRYQLTHEVGINVTANQRVPGPFYNFNLKNRNTFGGLEIFQVSGRFGIDGVTSYSNNGRVANSLEVGGNLSLTLPDFVFPLGNNFKSRLGELNPKTRISVGYEFVDRDDFTRDNLNASLGYSWQRDQSRLFNFTLADINLINTRNESEEFKDVLDESDSLGTSFHRAFERSFVSSMYFNSLFDFNQYGSYQNKSSYLRLFAESGGTFLNFFGTGFLERDSLQNYKFLKFNVDYRKLIPLSARGALAWRLNAGIGIPYGDNLILPYEKNFFAGGSSSIRAWGPRRLGPGSYTPLDENGIIDYNFEQPGEIIFEASLEFRQNLVGFLDWAFFIDAGNIWTIRDDVSDDGEVRRPGGKFEANRFYKEIAVGTGLGLRMDFTFLIMRVDLGIKAYEPARPEGQRWVLDDFKFGGLNDTTENSITLNIGIGYPF